MRKNIFCAALSAVVFALCVTAEAQQQAKIYKVGEIAFRSVSVPATGRELLRRELRKLGYVDGKNIIFETRFAEGRLDRLPAAAEELARLKVDVIIATSTPEILAAKNASRTIPIVFIYPGDPVAAGLVESLARPGGNMTGFSYCVRVGRQTAGVAQGNSAQAIPSCSAVGSKNTSGRTDLERKPTGGTRTGPAASFDGSEQHRSIR